MQILYKHTHTLLTPFVSKHGSSTLSATLTTHGFSDSATFIDVFSTTCVFVFVDINETGTDIKVVVPEVVTGFSKMPLIGTTLFPVEIEIWFDALNINLLGFTSIFCWRESFIIVNGVVFVSTTVIFVSSVFIFWWISLDRPISSIFQPMIKS